MLEPTHEINQAVVLKEQPIVVETQDTVMKEHPSVVKERASVVTLMKGMMPAPFTQSNIVVDVGQFDMMMSIIVPRGPKAAGPQMTLAFDALYLTRYMLWPEPGCKEVNGLQMKLVVKYDEVPVLMIAPQMTLSVKYDEVPVLMIAPQMTLAFDADDTVEMRQKWLAECLDKLACSSRSIAPPYRIGCEIAGGNWEWYQQQLKS